MGDNVYATSLNRTATIFPFLLFSCVCLCESSLSLRPFPSSRLATQTVPASGCGGLLGVGGKFCHLATQRKKILKLAVPKILWGKNFLHIRHIFRKNKIEIATFA